MKIIYYTYLKDIGGATTVARLVANYLHKKYKLTFEHWVEKEKIDWSKLNLASFFHLHASKKLLQVLEKLTYFKGKVFITIHDFQVLSGGCLSPFNCFNWQKECQECPLGFKDSSEFFAVKKEFLLKIKPTLIYPCNWIKKMGKFLFPNLKHKLIYNGVDCELNPDLSKSRYQKKIVLLIASSPGINYIKGSDSWKPIVESLLAKDKEVKIIMVGGEKIVFSSLNWQARFTQVPFLSREEVLKLLTKASLLLYTARVDNFPLLILESMACGLPVVGYEVGGIKEQVLNQLTGCLVPSLDEDKLIETGLELLKEPALLAKMAKEARSRWQKFFQVKNMAKEYYKLYVQS